MIIRPLNSILSVHVLFLLSFRLKNKWSLHPHSNFYCFLDTAFLEASKFEVFHIISFHTDLLRKFLGMSAVLLRIGD